MGVVSTCMPCTHTDTHRSESICMLNVGQHMGLLANGIHTDDISVKAAGVLLQPAMEST